MKISTALTRAIRHLHTGRHQDPCPAGTFLRYFSCDAVRDVVGWHDDGWEEVAAFLTSLGLDVTSDKAFDEFEFDHERQQARALWLTFAALYAKELGL